MIGLFHKNNRNGRKMNNELKKINSEDVTKLPLIEFENEIVVVEDIEHYKQIIPELAIESLFGFDTETRPSFKKGRSNKVSLLQLSTKNKVYLFRLNKIELPGGLLKILNDKSKLKVGVAIRDDIKQLQHLNSFIPNGFIDLQSIIEKNGIGELGLRKMSALVLNRRISKSSQLSNWESEKLTEKQKIYAATDAWISLEIYKRLLHKN